MKILFVSDLHYFHPWFDWLRNDAPDRDVLVIAGDLLNQNHPTPHHRQVEWASAWIQQLAGPLCISSGNHDRTWDSRANQWNPASWLRQVERADFWACGDVAVIDGISLQTTEYRASIPDEAADILITHSPPHGSTVSRSEDGWDGGEPDLTELIKDRSPKMLLCGHQHLPNQWFSRLGDTLCINPGMQLGARVPNHIMIDTENASVSRYVFDELSPDVQILDGSHDTCGQLLENMKFERAETARRQPLTIAAARS